MLKRDEIINIATLARIGLGEKDIEKYQGDLSAILGYFDKLSQADVSSVEPIGHITGRQDVFRNDKNEDFGELGKAAILQNAPEIKEEQIKVKSVL